VLYLKYKSAPDIMVNKKYLNWEIYMYLDTWNRTPCYGFEYNNNNNNNNNNKG